MNPLFDLLTKSELALELDASIAELNAKQARIDAQAERIKALESTCQFIVNNRDKFEEHDPDGVKKATISFLDLQLAQKGGGNG